MASNNNREWDISLTPRRGNDQILLAFPMAISRGLRAAGMNKARVTVDEDGIHLKPYVGDSGRSDAIKIPAQWTEGANA